MGDTDEADWETAVGSASLAGYHAYLERHPSGAHATEAGDEIDRAIPGALDESFRLFVTQEYAAAESLLTLILDCRPADPLALNNLAVIEIDRADSLLDLAWRHCEGVEIKNVAAVATRTASSGMLVRAAAFARPEADLGDLEVIHGSVFIPAGGVALCPFEQGPVERVFPLSDGIEANLGYLGRSPGRG